VEDLKKGTRRSDGGKVKGTYYPKSRLSGGLGLGEVITSGGTGEWEGGVTQKNYITWSAVRETQSHSVYFVVGGKRWKKTETKGIDKERRMHFEGDAGSGGRVGDFRRFLLGLGATQRHGVTKKQTREGRGQTVSLSIVFWERCVGKEADQCPLSQGREELNWGLHPTDTGRGFL